jgi:hypothetical protein
MKKLVLLILLGSVIILFFFSPVFFTDKIFFQRDTLLLFHPWMTFARESISSGELPFWNPFTQCGLPFLANMQSGIFYLPNVFFFFLNFAAAYKIYIFMHFLMSIVFMYFLLTDFEIDSISSITAALMWTFSGTMLTRIEFLSVLGTTVWLPLSLLALRVAIREPEYKNLLLFSLALSIQFFAGHPQEYFYSLLLLIGYAIFETLNQGKIKIIYIFVICIFLTCLISAILLLPSIEFILNSYRMSGNHSLGLSRKGASLFCIEIGDIKNLIYPFYYQKEVIEKMHNEGILYIPHLWIKSHHVGILGFIFFLVGIIKYRFREKVFFISLIVLSILLALDKNAGFIFDILYKFFIPIRLFRHPATIMYLVTFSICLIAAFGFSAIKRKSLKYLIMFSLLLELFIYGNNLNIKIPSVFFRMVGPNIKFLMENAGRNRFTLTPMTYNAIKSKSFSEYKDKLFGNVNIPFHIYNFYGQDTQVSYYFRYLDRVYSKNSITEAKKLFSIANVKYMLSFREFSEPDFKLVKKGSFYIYENLQCLPRAFLVQKASFLPETMVLNHMESSSFDPRKETVIISRNVSEEKHPAYGRSMVENIALYNNNVSISVINDSDCWLVLSDLYYPGWTAYVDNEKVKILRANYMFRAVKLKSGSHRILFSYMPLTFLFGKIITFASISAAFLVFLAKSIFLKKSSFLNFK